MPNLKEVKNRISSVQATQQITKAMKMVAAAKLRKAQAQALVAQEALTHTQLIAQRSIQPMEWDEESTAPLLLTRPVTQEIVVLITSDKGLCGVFNSSASKATVQYIQQQKNIDIQAVPLGKKGRDFLKRQQVPLLLEDADFFALLSYNKVASVANQLIQHFIQGRCQRVTLIYNRSQSGTENALATETLLPLPLPPLTTDQRLYLHEPSPEELMAYVLPLLCRLRLQAAVLNSLAIEHNARMIAMDTATENAADLLKELRLHYNRTRQAVITQEILEIVSGTVPK